jgi:hypothetical protein
VKSVLNLKTIAPFGIQHFEANSLGGGFYLVRFGNQAEPLNGLGPKDDGR